MIDLRKLSKKQFLTGMNLALKNARSLLREAHLLAERSVYGRAAALAVLSLEESGKVVFLTICSHRDRLKSDQKTLNRLWRQYTNHQTKIDFFESWYRRKWRGVLYVRKRKHDGETEQNTRDEVAPSLKALQAVYGYIRSKNLTSIAELKLKCLYVDIDEKTHDFSLPYKIPYKVVKGLMLLAKSQIEDAGQLRDASRRGTTDQISDDITAVMFKPQMLRLLRDRLGLIAEHESL
jgi:AbiV family abortive infection protein